MGFNQTRQPAKPVRQETVNHQGGAGFTYADREALYMLVVSSLMSGDTFYETADERTARFRSLVAAVAKEPGGPEFLEALTWYTRAKMHLRTTPTILAAEAFLLGLPNAKALARQSWVRGDEHLEAMAYVDKFSNKTWPQAFKRAVKERLEQLSDYQLVKYAAGNKQFSQCNAFRLFHPVPADDRQSALFAYVTREWGALTEQEKGLLPDSILALKNGSSSGMIWEQIISKEGSSAASWKKATQVMGYMALLRNLRNICIHLGDDKEVVQQVAAKIGNPDEVRRSKQLPFRFIAARRALANTPSVPVELVRALYDAADIASEGVTLDGHNLILADMSGSMSSPLAKMSSITGYEAGAAVAALFSRRGNCEVWAFGTTAARAAVSPATRVLDIVDALCVLPVGHCTETASALQQAFAQARAPFDRVFVITDMQTMSSSVSEVLYEYRKKHSDMRYYGINVMGYGLSMTPGDTKTVDIGGFSEKIVDFALSMERADPCKQIIKEYAAWQAAQASPVKKTSVDVA